MEITLSVGDSDNVPKAETPRRMPRGCVALLMAPFVLMLSVQPCWTWMMTHELDCTRLGPTDAWVCWPLAWKSTAWAPLHLEFETDEDAALTDEPEAVHLVALANGLCLHDYELAERRCTERTFGGLACEVDFSPRTSAETGCDPNDGVLLGIWLRGTPGHLERGRA